MSGLFLVHFGRLIEFMVESLIDIPSVRPIHGRPRIALTVFMKTRITLFFIVFSLLNSLVAQNENSLKVLGDTQIKMGLAAVESTNYRDALRLLRLGVHNSPSNLEGRSVLSEFFELALERPDLASDTLITGLEHGGVSDIDYLKQTLRVLLRHQMDVEIQAIADQYLPPEPELNDHNRTLAFGAANACYLRGQLDRAEAYLEDYNLIESLEGVLLSAQISWDRGDQLASIRTMETNLEKFPNSEPLLMQLSRYNREMGNTEEAKRYAILRVAKDPLAVAPRLELLYIYNLLNDAENMQSTIQNIFDKFAEDQGAMQALANFAADTGNPELCRNIYELANEQAFVLDSFALLLIESLLVNKNYAGAEAFTDSIYEDNPDWLPNRWAIFSSLRAVISAAQNGSGKGNPAYMRDFLSDPSTPSQTYLAVARRFNSNDCAAEAFQVLSVANEKFPSNQKVTTEYIEICLELGRLETAFPPLNRLLDMRRPDKALLSEALIQLKQMKVSTPECDGLILKIEVALKQAEETS